MNFIGINSLNNSYVVGMNLTKGYIDFGCYKYKNRNLKKMD